MHTIPVQTSRREQLIDITSQVQQCLSESGVTSGLVCVFVPHTTAGVTINEDADPDVVTDVLGALAKIVAQNAGYRHVEGNSDAHVKSSMIGPSLTVIVEEGKLQLGTWQGIYFAEFDGPRSRQCWVKIVES